MITSDVNFNSYILPSIIPRYTIAFYTPIRISFFQTTDSIVSAAEMNTRAIWFTWNMLSFILCEESDDRTRDKWNSE